MLVDVLFISFFMLTKELEYELPEGCIAQSPTRQRDESRLFVYDRARDEVNHHFFHELPSLLPPQLSILRNDVSVLKARLYGQRPSGGKVECLLLRPSSSSSLVWRCLIKPGAKTAKAKVFSLTGEYEAKVIDSLPSGEYLVQFNLPKDPNPHELAQRIGTLPLPHYVRRSADKSDEERYQTIYANPKHRSAAAAPTAGLHFTKEILEKLTEQGHRINELTLSVGVGTFRPIETERVEDHLMHAEEYILSPSTKSVLRAPHSRRLAIGTTSVRAIEHYLSRPDENPQELTRSEARLFIQPPYSFQGVDHLLTNFHLPGSTLLCLVSAFLAPNETNGLDKLKQLYKEAISRRYRFYSYGDAMLIL